MSTHNSGAAQGGPSIQPTAPMVKAGSISMLLPMKHFKFMSLHSRTFMKFTEECFSPIS